MIIYFDMSFFFFYNDKDWSQGYLYLACSTKSVLSKKHPSQKDSVDAAYNTPVGRWERTTP